MKFCLRVIKIKPVAHKQEAKVKIKIQSSKNPKQGTPSGGEDINLSNLRVQYCN